MHNHSITDPSTTFDTSCHVSLSSVQLHKSPLLLVPRVFPAVDSVGESSDPKAGQDLQRSPYDQIVKSIGGAQRSGNRESNAILPIFIGCFLEPLCIDFTTRSSETHKIFFLSLKPTEDKKNKKGKLAAKLILSSNVL